MQTDHVLFIASGAFHIAKPSDLLPELQGRLPIRVELRALTEADFVRILTETDNALTRQYSALMATEEVSVDFTPDGIAALARIAAEVNRAVENIGARRLQTVLERVFEDLSFTAPDRGGDSVTVDAGFVEAHLGELSRSADLSRYVLERGLSGRAPGAPSEPPPPVHDWRSPGPCPQGQLSDLSQLLAARTRGPAHRHALENHHEVPGEFGGIEARR